MRFFSFDFRAEKSFLGSASYPNRDALIGATLIGNKPFLHFTAAPGTF